MSNFIDISKVPELLEKKNILIESALLDLKYFLKNLPPEQEIKYNKILQADFIKMYSIPLKYDQLVECPCSGDLIEIFNFTADGPELNYNGGTGRYAQDIKDLLGPLHPHHHLSLFSNTIKNIPECLRTSWIFFYKQGATVIENEGHGHEAILLHFLLEDIPDGYFSVNVNGEERKISQKGEHFIFNGIVPHGAEFNGSSAVFLVFAMNKEDLLNYDTLH